jgi:site-specific DNA-cytosine methylase
MTGEDVPLGAGKRLGSLFSGIGGFELAWQRNGGEIAWMCEIDKKARQVLEARFPGVPIYEDVEQLDPAEVKAVDVLSGGSPCQGFSIAGARTGMLHGESRLFADYVRILEGLIPRGLRWAVWENVPGVLSIKDKETGERTFEHVIGALVGADGPVRLDPKRKWNFGVVAGPGRSVAWRVVDSRHFGVPQRRRRVYAAIAVGDTDGGRAGRAVLALPEGLRRDPPACVTKGEATSRGARGRAGEAGGGVVGALTSRMQGSSGWAPYNEAEHIIPDEVGTLTTAFGSKNYSNIQEVVSGSILPDVPGTPITPEVSGTVTSKWAKGSGGPAGSSTEVSNLVGQWWDGEQDAATLTSTSDSQRMPDKDRLQAVLDPQAFNLMPESGQGADLVAIPTDHSPAFVSTYPADRGVRVVEVVDDGDATFRKLAHGHYVEDDDSSTVAARDHKADTDLIVPAGKNRGVLGAFRKSRRAQSSTDAETWVEDGDANTLNVFDVGDTRTTHAVLEAIPIQDTREVEKRQNGIGVGQPGDPSYTLDTASRQGVAHAVDVDSLTPWPEMGEAMRVYGDSGASPALKRSSPNILESQGVSYDGYNQSLEVGTHRSLRTGRDSSDFVADAATLQYGVRRLTPVECERLQAFPDGWTEPSGSDSARYKTLGNAITVNVAQWLFGRVLEVDRAGS